MKNSKPMASSSKENVTYPLPSSSVNVSNYVDMKLSSSNFLLWKMQVIPLFESEDMMGFIDGEYNMPERMSEAFGDMEGSINPKYVA